MIAVTPFQPAGQIYDSMGEQIRVVPNPYRLDFSDPFICTLMWQILTRYDSLIYQSTV
ncbi:MAG: hypothetical protein CM1200mP10_11370 [Candidatus Neomarinimicrobiota bacterium]|nr:MAG: hypothetical protein CM1200mP10_11370 [Candidatus Neomarinimicrobiota bacterium]